LFGSNVALAGDGSTALIGAQASEAVYVFGQTSTGWTEEGPPLTDAAAPNHVFGAGLALSDDGSVAVVSGQQDTRSGEPVWTFVRSGARWIQLASVLVVGATDTNCPYYAGSSLQPQSVALSGDGNTLLVSDSLANCGAGAAYVFGRTVTGWQQEGPPLTVSGLTSFAPAGAALSADGQTSLITGQLVGSNVIKAWVFSRSGVAWTQSAVLTGSGSAPPVSIQGGASLSADGSRAAFSSGEQEQVPGVAWLFARSGGRWAQEGSPLRPRLTRYDAPSTGFGSSLALASNGNAVLVGSPKYDDTIGATWAYTPTDSILRPQERPLLPKDDVESPCKRSSHFTADALLLSGHVYHVQITPPVRVPPAFLRFTVQIAAPGVPTMRTVVRGHFPCLDDGYQTPPTSRLSGLVVSIFVRGTLVYRRAFPGAANPNKSFA
jgi:hypothetical protein